MIELFKTVTAYFSSHFDTMKTEIWNSLTDSVFRRCHDMNSTTS